MRFKEATNVNSLDEAYNMALGELETAEKAGELPIDAPVTLVFKTTGEMEGSTRKFDARIYIGGTYDEVLAHMTNPAEVAEG